jgi:hypothetical protein
VWLCMRQVLSSLFLLTPCNHRTPVFHHPVPLPAAPAYISVHEVWQ